VDLVCELLHFSSPLYRQEMSIRDVPYAHLACIVVKPNVEVKLEEILVVRHYPDFLAEVTSLPPEHNTEFTNELMLGNSFDLAYLHGERLCCL
jgi:hypothetical protein